MNSKRMFSNRVSLVPDLILLAALAVLMAVPAYAGGPLAKCQSGVPFLWPAGGTNIPFNPDQGDLGPVASADAIQLVTDAFQVWADVPSSTVTYTNAGLLPLDVDITNFGPFLNPVAPDGLSAIVFDDTGEIFDLLFGPGTGVLGFAGPEWVDTATCEILEGVSFLNGPSFTDLTAALDVTVHEFGHYTNLAHIVVNGQNLGFGDASGPTPFNDFGNAAVTDVGTMYPFYFGPGSGTQTLHADDIATVSTLYPEASFFSSTVSISGSILAADGATRLSGVNVIARNIADPFGDAVSAISGDFTDGTTQADPVVGTFTINGLTPGADYVLFDDEILAGGFSTPPASPLQGPEEYYNGASESTDPTVDDPSDFVLLSGSAGDIVSGVDIIFNSLPPGAIPLGDDDTVQIPLPFAFEFCGIEYTSVFVNSNGSISFGEGDLNFLESAAGHLEGPPRIAGLWDDLNPSAGGVVSFSQSSHTFIVRFDNVPEFPATGANTFSIELKRWASHATLDWESITATDGLVGYSCGGAVTSTFEEETNISRKFGVINGRNDPAIYEIFTEDDFDLNGRDRLFLLPKNAFRDRYEHNDSLRRAKKIRLPFDTIEVRDFTAIEPLGDDVDFFEFDLKAGRTLVAEVIAGQLDSFIGLFDADTGELLATDDDGGSGLLSRLVFSTDTRRDLALAVTTFPDSDFSGDGGSSGRYVLQLQEFEGIVLNLGDDTSVEVALDFPFPFNGQTYNSVFVNSNGNLTFGLGDSDFSESVSEFLTELPRIAPLWDDLSPNVGGVVVFDGGATQATITFDAVPEFLSSTTNTFSVHLDADGNINFDYGDVAALDGLVGITEGGGAADPGATDLSAASGLSETGTTYELFSLSTGDFDLDGQTVIFGEAVDDDGGSGHHHGHGHGHGHHH